MKKTFALPKIDFAFRWIFTRKENADILKAFLEAILGLAILTFEIKNFEDPHLLRASIGDKLGILDLLVTLTDGTKINVEMQLFSHKYLPERIVYYASKILSFQMNASEDYSNLKKVICILIVNENLTVTSPNYYHSFHLYDKNNNVRFTDLVGLKANFFIKSCCRDIISIRTIEEGFSWLSENISSNYPNKKLIL
jgi:predicted transposase/invertase (TIGR01784 family)